MSERFPLDADADDRLDDDADTAKKPRVSQATEIVTLVKAHHIELWHAPAGDAFATVPVDDHREHHPLARVVRDYVARAYFIEHKRAASSSALTDAAAALAGMAKYDGDEHAVAVRLAGHDGRLYLDLGAPDWSVVEITATGWRLTTTSPVRHWRPKSLRPLPVPVAGGSLHALRALWPNVSDDAWTLIVCWLVSALLPGGPYPILVLVGEQGSGKSTLGRMLRGVLDPASPALRGVPRDERDVVIGAATNYVVALDNLSGMAPWLSDALCRISTGGGFATRQLFTDADELTIDVCRPILLTGIDSPASRGDLLDRALVVSLPAMSDEARGDEAELWRRYEAMRPALLGALLDAAVGALAHRDEVRLDRRPRMADAATWVTAAEPALGWPSGTTISAWLGARQTAAEDLIAEDAVAQTLITYMTTAGIWSGTTSMLLTALTTTATDTTKRSRTWPTSPRGLSSALRRLAPDLRRAGVQIDFPDDRHRTARQRGLRIVTTVTPSQSADSGPDSADSPNDGRRDGRDGRSEPSLATVTPESGDSWPDSADRDGRDDRDDWPPYRSGAEVEP